MAVKLSPLAGAGWQFFDNLGTPLAGGLLYTYTAGTTTPQATYTSAAGTIANTNPIVLDAAGRTANQTWLTTGGAYKFVLQTSAAVTIGTYDNISGINDLTGSLTSVSVVSANGFAGTVANPTTIPAITLSTTVTGLLKGNGTAISAATANTDYQSPITLTTTGTSGAATFTSNTLNIPQYSSGGGSGLTLLSTTPLTNGLSTISITDLASSKYFVVAINFWDVSPSIPGGDLAYLNIALSSNNGSTYGSTATVDSINNSGGSSILYIYLTNISGVSKIYFGSSSAAEAMQYTSVTGIINAIQFTLTAGYTYTSSGNLYIYGMN